MSLFDAIAEALANANPPPKTESTTCDRIIYPLLREGCGYTHHDIESQVADSGGKIPDYAILSDSPQGWYLEAKAWSVPLEDKHVTQAVDYAHHNGRRWVVLTNGQEWRLYDDTIQGLDADRLSATVRLDGGDSFEAFLTALGKPSVCGGALERYAARVRLEQFLAGQLADENSESVRAVHGVVKRQRGLGSVSLSEVAAILKAGSAEPGSSTHGPADSPATASLEAPADGKASDATGACVPLDAARSHIQKYVTGHSPAALTMPDGSSMPVQSWAGVARELVSCLMHTGHAPAVPFKGHCKGKRWFLNSAPMHETKPMHAHTKIEANGQSVYLNTHMSGREFVERLCDVCEAVGVPASSFVVTLSS